MRALLLAVSVVAALPVAASAQANPQADRNAYTYAVRCFAAAGFARQRGVQTDNGKRAYDMALRLGSQLGYTPSEADGDIRTRTSTELVTMRRDAAYLDRAFSDCRRIGLL